MRREVTNPTRHGPEFSTETTLVIKSLPRRVKPSRFTRSYSDACVRRRVLGKENESARFMLISISYHKPERCWRAELRGTNLGLAKLADPIRHAASVQQKSSPKEPGRRLLKKSDVPESRNRAAIQPAIRPLQEEIPLLQRDWLPQSLLRAESWRLELPPARLSRSFARTPRVARHWPGCRCIFS